HRALLRDHAWLAQARYNRHADDGSRSHPHPRRTAGWLDGRHPRAGLLADLLDFLARIAGFRPVHAPPADDPRPHRGDADGAAFAHDAPLAAYAAVRRLLSRCSGIDGRLKWPPS